METQGTHTVRTGVIVACCIVAAILCRNIGMEASGFILRLLRSFIYIGLFTFWCISLRRRVIQTQVRRFLTAISGLMLFWIIDRTIKFLFVSDPFLMRYLWYLYYLPMLLIPFLLILVAASLGKMENYRIPKWVNFLYIPAFAFLLLVLTNDLHQLVFVFPSDAVVWSDIDYTYGIGYLFVFGFMVCCALTAFGIIIAKCRSSRTRKTSWQPLVFMAGAIAYGAAYALEFCKDGSPLHYIAGDVTVSLCLIFAGLLECCLWSGLIPSNTGYDSLYKSLYVGMQITDKNYNVCYASDIAKPLSLLEMMRTKQSEYLVDKTTLLRSYPIKGGYAIWQEDVSELVRLKAELESIKEELQDRNDLLREQYRRDAQRYRLEEQNRLYDLVQQETQKQLKEIDILAKKFAENPKQSAECKSLLLRILVLATYIKRYKDMVITADRSVVLPLNLLEGALRESCSNLVTAKIGGNLYVPYNEILLPVEAALTAYGLFEDALVSALSTLSYFFVTVAKDDEGMLSLKINFVSSADLTFLAEKYKNVSVEHDEDSWFISQKLTDGGDER